MKRLLYVLLVLAVASLLRLYPTLISGMPFSTDSWPPIRNTELLVEHTPIRLNDEVFDGYNNYWPANSLFGAVFSQTIGLEPRQAMALIFPVIGAFAILVFYALIDGLFEPEVALMASMVFATAFSHAIFTAGITKEGYGNPLYLLLILIFLRLEGGAGRVLLFTITSIALALTHHLTPLVAIAVLSCMALARFMADLRSGSHLNKLSFPLVGVLAFATLAYYLLYAQEGFKVQLTASDWLSAASYQLAAFALAEYFAFKKPSQSRMRSLLMCSAAAAIPLLFIGVAVKTPIMPGAPVLPSRYLLYAIPFLLSSSLTYLGYQRIRGARIGHGVEALFWLNSVLGLEGFAVFGGSSLGSSLAYRAVNFLWPPLSLLCAVGLHRLYAAARKPHGRGLTARLIAAATIITVATIALLNSYAVYAAVSLGERYMGYFWLYTPPEYRAAEWVKGAAGGLTVAGDVKALYLLKCYFNVDVDVLQGLRYLSGGAQRPQALFVYQQMFKNGYVMWGGYSLDLPRNWMERAYSLNHVYSNGLANVYVG
jgi:putative flippase GtrA